MIPGEDYPEALTRYSQRKSIDKLSRRFHLRTDPQMQDWEVEVSDPKRVMDFVNAYGDTDFDDDDRFALMALIVASLDDAIAQGLDVVETWNRVVPLLRRDAGLHASTLSYWSRGDDPNPHHQFHVTPWIRVVWHGIRDEL